jgi:hypothetical protein
VASTARASASTSTRTAPARFNARAQASAVAPGRDHVVDDHDPLSFDAGRAGKVHLEGLPGNVPPPLVGREPHLTCRPPHPLGKKQSTPTPESLATPWASIADWLNRRHHSREE